MHSIPQLELLSAAACRMRAKDGLLDMQIIVSAVAATRSKQGLSSYKRLAAALEKQANGH